MKIDNIIYSPIFSVLLATVLLIISLRYGNYIFSPHQDAVVVPASIQAPEIKIFEPDVYKATVIQVGGVGSDIYTNHAYYIGNGSGIHQEGWPDYLDKNIYAPVSFNTPFYLMTLSCRDGYAATLLPEETSDPEAHSAIEDKQNNSLGLMIEIKEKIKNELSIKCQKISQNISIKQLHEEAYELMQAKDYPGALKKAEAAIQFDPNYINAYVDKGMALYSMGKCADGATSLYHAVNLDPENENLGAMLGSVLNKCSAITEECKYVFDRQLEDSKLKVGNNKTAIEIIKNKCFLILDSSVIADFDGDGQKEIAMITSGAGCGSCHAQEIRIIKGDEVIFYKDGSDFMIKLADDLNGFTLQYSVISLPPNPGDEYIIESYKARKGGIGLEAFYVMSQEKKSYNFE